MTNLIPFNGDTFITQEFLKLKEQFSITCAVETGTNLGETTYWLAENFNNVFTMEINENYLELSKKNCIDMKNINFLLGDSSLLIKDVIDIIKNERTIFFLDAHWGDYCPTPAELTEIKKMIIKPVIVIHDFHVPGKSHPEGMHNIGHPGWGWDYYPNFKYNWESIEKFIFDIYGEDYTYYYNDEVNGARRGCIYITPKLETEND
jgi:hypothetical protein